MNTPEYFDYTEVEILRTDIDFQVFEYAYRKHSYHVPTVLAETGVTRSQVNEWKRVCQLPNHQSYIDSRRIILRAVSALLVEQGWTYADVAKRYGSSSQAIGRYVRETRRNGTMRKAIRVMWADALRSRGCTESAIARWMQNPSIAPSLAMLDGVAEEVA